MKYRGFTFVELLIALSLFTVGILGVMQVIPANKHLLNQSAAISRAVFLAQERMEELRGVAYDALTEGTYEVRAALPGDASSPFTQFERRTVVEFIDTNRQVTGVDEGLKRVTVTIFWNDRSMAREYNLTTYVASN